MIFRQKPPTSKLHDAIGESKCLLAKLPSNDMRSHNFFRHIIPFLAWSLLHADYAWAYVDPGSGMLMIQSLIALCVGIIAYLRNPWQSILAFFKRMRKKEDA